MLAKALVLTDGEADLLSCALEEVKTKTFEESETSLRRSISYKRHKPNQEADACKSASRLPIRRESARKRDLTGPVK